MPLARVQFPKFSGDRWAGAALLLLLTGCSSPKSAGPALPPGSPVVDAASRSNAATNSGGQADRFIATVRLSTMSGYPQTTIGHAFEAVFSDAHWQSQEIEGGAHVVRFTGLLPPNMRAKCGVVKAGRPAPTCTQDPKVTFEWTFASDGLFHLSHVDPEPWPDDHRSTREMLLYIYG